MMSDGYCRQTVGRRRAAFTLVEVLVTAALVAVAVVAALGGIRSLEAADIKAHKAILLRRLAMEKIADLRILSDPSQAGGAGDFSDRGYDDITWSADIEPTSVSNLDQVTITATQGKDSQDISTLIYVPASTNTTTSASSGGGG